MEGACRGVLRAMYVRLYPRPDRIDLGAQIRRPRNKRIRSLCSFAKWEQAGTWTSTLSPSGHQVLSSQLQPHRRSLDLLLGAQIAVYSHVAPVVYIAKHDSCFNKHCSPLPARRPMKRERVSF
ncbi:hypothetical protein K437DRAFT_254314 [Tilletiaria anomala UBC 951]|uniref:Uncharacterized protein n=1 Tax=Tilletiaria anomala (strain ATCC 24038 / CBS 436.72 / UBC 951) TaxID=1037660 RepID=A0A066WEI5_TILAU|nr:uncharacterized protein K437DRAFT_254314 [Tilletiaria anomala UBC 951]KDN52332.1 hypothetical protein K437DRAFT_254314 [Tilletiaria anomala UBC 951]